MNNERAPRVLLLDDERMLLLLYKTKFEKNGFEVATFNDADSALAALRGGYEPDVILFDITMPQQRSGYDFLETVQNERLATHSLKIALTNEGQDGEMARSMELGADAHWIKAKYLPSELVAEVRKIMSEKSAAA